VLDVGTLETGAPYMVMEYLEGQDLSAIVEKHSPLPIADVVDWVLQAAEALAEAHALGIVHRDLKPANLFLTRRADGTPSVKVLDFGISKLTGLSASSRDMAMTRTQSIMGSPYYMSPEQMQSSKGVDARADIWALGVILFELLAGRVPFQGEAIPELVLNIVNSPTPPLRAFRPDVPPALEAVIGKCLEKNRDRRYGNIAELAHALSSFAPKRSGGSVERIARVIENAGLSGGTSSPAPPLQGPPVPAPGGTVATWGQTAPGSGGKTKAVAGIVAVVALAGACAVLFVWKRASVHAVSAAPTISASAAAPAPSPPPPPAAADTPAPAEVVLAPPAESAPPPAPSSPVPATAKPVAAAANPLARPAGPAKPNVPAKPVCSAVPYLDAEGNTHFKQVCN
jgi:hypothetical protein